MKKLLLGTIILVISAFTSPAFCGETLRLTNGEWPPFLSENMKHHGYSSYVVDQIFSSQDVSVKYGFFPWKRTYVLAEKGDGWDGTLLWSKNDERVKKFLYTEPVVELKGVLFHRKDKPLSWTKWEDLKGLRIGVTRSYTYGKEFEAALAKGIFKTDEAVSDALGFKKLLAGRIDAMACEFEVGYAVINKNLPKDKTVLITNSPTPYRITTFHVLLSKQYPKAQKMVDTFNKGLSEFKASGKMAEMEKEFLSGKFD